MEEKFYFHLFANGDDAKAFIICYEDFVFQFNLVGVCAYVSGIEVLAFNLEESHPHLLLYGTLKQCAMFMWRYRHSTVTHIGKTRGTIEGVIFRLEKIIIDSEGYLRNVAAYVIIQPTKDGKRIMHYDYKWGTGSMYFRDEAHIPIWQFDNEGQILATKAYAELHTHEQEAISSKTKLPDNWKIVKGLILPDNYINIKRYEDIFRTHNCFRVFGGAGKNQINNVILKMSEIRGINMDDSEARKVCHELCLSIFGTTDRRSLNVNQRMELAAELKKKYHLSIRQLSVLCFLPENEIAKYFR